MAKSLWVAQAKAKAKVKLAVEVVQEPCIIELSVSTTRGDEVS